MVTLFHEYSQRPAQLAGALVQSIRAGFTCLLHFFHPGASLCVCLLSFVDLVTGYSSDLHRILGIFLGCLKAGMGGSKNMALKAGCANNIVLWCFCSTVLAIVWVVVYWHYHSVFHIL
jgi:hypothetical protein